MCEHLCVLGRVQRPDHLQVPLRLHWCHKNVCSYAIGYGLLLLIEEIVNLLVLVLGSAGEILDEICYLLHLYYYY
jgi:hypothetical protein